MPENIDVGLQWIDDLDAESKDYLMALDRAIYQYCKKKSVSASNKVLLALLKGIEENRSLAIFPIMDWHFEHTAERQYYCDKRKRKYLSAYSNYNSFREIFSEPQTLRGLIRLIDADPECGGLAINPGQKNAYFVRKELLVGMLDAGYAAVDNERAPEKAVLTLEGQGTEQLLIRTPISEEAFNLVADKIRYLDGAEGRDLIIHVREGRGLPYSVFLTGGPEIHILIKSITSDPFDQENIEVFHEYKDLPTEQIVDTMRRKLLYSEPTVLIEHISPKFCGNLLNVEEEKEFVQFWSKMYQKSYGEKVWATI